MAFRVCSSSRARMASADGDGKSLLRLELFPFSWKQLLHLESSSFSSTSPNEKIPPFRVHQNCAASKVVLKLSAAVGPRNTLFLLSLLSQFGSFSPSFPATNNVGLALGAWQPSPLSTARPRAPVPRRIPCECSGWSSLLACNVLCAAQGPLLLFVTSGCCWGAVGEGGWQMFAPCFPGWCEAISHASASGGRRGPWWPPWHLPVCHSLTVSPGKM